MGQFSQVIGYCGTDHAECCWLVVLLDPDHLVTAYPIIHPHSLQFMH